MTLSRIVPFSPFAARGAIAAGPRRGHEGHHGPAHRGEVEGAFSAPPCSEGGGGHVLSTPVEAVAARIGPFQARHRHNARAVVERAC